MHTPSQIRKLSIAAFVVLLIGCNSLPIETIDTTEVPPDQILILQTEASASTTQVIFKRSRWIIGSACPARLFSNGVPLVDLYGGQRATFNLPQGSALFSARLQGLPCPSETREIRVELAPGKTRTFLFDVSQSWGIIFQETAF